MSSSSAKGGVEWRGKHDAGPPRSEPEAKQERPAAEDEKILYGSKVSSASLESRASAKSKAPNTYRRPPIVYLAKMRGGINFLCDTIRALGWSQGGMRDCSQCDFYMVGPQIGLKLASDDDFRALREDQACSRFPKMDWVTLKAPTTLLLSILSDYQNPVTAAPLTPGRFRGEARDTTNPKVFYPLTFVLPRQMDELCNALYPTGQEEHLKNAEPCCYIVKPSKGSQGNGIQLCFGAKIVYKCAETMCQAGPCVAQRYLSNPYTLNGMKWDARIYCVVTSVGPLEAWMYMDGLARFCTLPYEDPNEENAGTDFMHLTNYSLNCKSQTFDPEMSKRSLSDVLDELEEDGVIAKEKFWTQANDLVAAVLVAFHPVLLSKYRQVFSNPKERCRCFHILGCDVLLTSDFKLHLLEVNCNPSLNLMRAGSRVIKSAVDVKVKTGLLQGALRLVDRGRNEGNNLTRADTENMRYRRVNVSVRGSKALEAAASYFNSHRNHYSRRNDGEATISCDFLQEKLQRVPAMLPCQDEYRQLLMKYPSSLSLVDFLDLVTKLGKMMPMSNDNEANVLHLLNAL